MLVIVATPGSAIANSYETLAEAKIYFESRLPLAGWDDADSQNVLLAMATRVLDMIARPHRKLQRIGDTDFYITSRQWTGVPASATQRLAWPRIGMFDANGNPLDVPIIANSVASPSIVTTNAPHGRTTGDSIFVVGSNSTPSLNGSHAVIVLSPTTFSVPVNVTIAGTTGTMTVIPQALKDAQSELAGQLGTVDTTLDNPVSIGGITSIKAGSVALTFKDQIAAHVLPEAVMNLLPPSWFTDELISYPENAEFSVI